MVWIVLVGFLPDNHVRSCKTHPYGFRHVLIEGEGNGVGHLVHLRLVEKVHLACYLVIMDGTDSFHICFVARKYASRETAHLLDGSLFRVTEVFLCKSPLYHRNRGYTYAETVEIGDLIYFYENIIELK